MSETPEISKGAPSTPETSPPSPSPFEQARELYTGMPEPEGAEADPNQRALTCSDGSRIEASDVYGDGSRYKFVVSGPDKGPLPNSQVIFGLAKNGGGSTYMPRPVVAPWRPRLGLPDLIATPANKSKQRDLIDWTSRIVQENKFSEPWLTIVL